MPKEPSITKSAGWLLSALLLPLAAHADDSLSLEYSDCMVDSGGVTSAMINCISAESKRQDDRLNRVYQSVMGQLNGERREELRNAQRLWIRYRDANCGFYANPDGGTIAQVDANHCLLRMTAERADELVEFMP